MKLFGTVKDIGVIFKAVKMKDTRADWPVYLFPSGSGVDVRSMDPARVSIVNVNVPVGAASVTLSDMPVQGTVYAVPCRFILDPLSYFGDQEGLSLSFEEGSLFMKVNNYQRAIKYVIDDSPPGHPTLSKIVIQKALVDVDDLVRAIGLTKDVGKVVTFKLSKSGFSVEGNSAEVGVTSGYQVSPEQMTLEEVDRTVVSSFDPAFLLEALPYAEGQVEIAMGERYPIVFRGTLKNGLRFVNYVAPRIENEDVKEDKKEIAP